MIVLRSVTKIFGRWSRKRIVLNDADATFETGGNYVLFGVRASGKTTLLRLLCGLDAPTTGLIRRYGTVSLPIGTATTVSGMRDTPRALATLLADLYRADRHDILHFVAAFTQMGEWIDVPFQAMNAEQRARLNQGFAYAVPADFHLFDGMLPIADIDFRLRCAHAFARRRETAGTIVATSNMRGARDLGDKGAILYNAKIYLFDSVVEALQAFEDIDVQNKQSSEAIVKQLVALGRLADAKAYLVSHVSENREDIAAYQMLAETCLKLGHFDEAIAAAGAMLDRDPEASEPYMVLARVAEREGRLLDAIANAEKVLQRDPTNRIAKFLIARSYELLEFHGEAATAWRRLAVPSASDTPLRLAIRNDIKAENWDRVLEMCDMAAEAGVADFALREIRSRSLLELKKWDDLKSAVADLAASDVDAAIRLLVRLLKADEWRPLADLLAVLPREELVARRDNRVVTAMTAYLKRRSRVLRRDGAIADADELEALAASFGEPAKVEQPAV